MFQKINDRILLFYKLLSVLTFILVNGIVPSDVKEFSKEHYAEVNNYLSNSDIVLGSGLINPKLVHRFRILYSLFYNKKLHNTYYRDSKGNLKTIYDTFDNMINLVNTNHPNNEGFMFELAFQHSGICILRTWNDINIKSSNISYAMHNMSSNDLIIMLASDPYFKKSKLTVMPYKVDDDEDIEVRIAIYENH